MAKLNIPKVSESSSNTLQFNQYLKSGSWKCPAGGAHYWVPFRGNEWKCRSCNITREFPCPDCAYGDMCYIRPWNMYREIDTLLHRA
jgi:hypothetical protein